MTANNPIRHAKTPSAGGAVATRPITPRLTPLILLTALSVLPVNMILPSLPHIAAALHADTTVTNLAVAGYAMVTALTEIVAGAISDRYGRRPVALTSIALFIVASLGCALATNIGVFLLFRALQASISACFSIALVIVKETSGAGKTVSRFGTLAMGWALAPMVGPFLGGTLDAAFGWRAIFVVLAILGAAILALCLRTLPETVTRSTEPSHTQSAAYRQLLRSIRFWAYALCMASSMGTLYIFLAGAPIAVGNRLGGSTAQLGLHMGIVPAGFMLGSYLAGRHAAGASLATSLIVARLLTCMGLLIGLGLSMTGTTDALALFGPCVFIGIGNGLTMPAANAGVLSVRADFAGTAAGLAAATSIAGGALIVSIGGPFVGGPEAVRALFAVMLVPAAMALLAAMGAAYVDRRR
jgi:MFS transporter, DHA1 family, multidrug resistance protein